ncbi:MAG: polyprenyl synthetase family protein [Myxococcota bacterium]
MAPAARPALVLLAAELCGYVGPQRIELAAARLLHTATLLHDDIVDLAELTPRPAVGGAIWGNRRAVLAGDFLYARASSMVVEGGNLAEIVELRPDDPRDEEASCSRLERSFDVGVNEAHYYDVIERKSATLLSNCCEIGSLLGGVTRSERRIAEVRSRQARGSPSSCATTVSITTRRSRRSAGSPSPICVKARSRCP